MTAEPFPSTVLFATLKSCGISNRDAAAKLLDPDATLGSRPVREVIESKSQLSRRIVHAAPESLPSTCFARFADSAPSLAARMLERRSIERHKGDLHSAARSLIDGELNAAHDDMMRSLLAHGTDGPSYREALFHIGRLAPQDVRDPLQRVTLHLLALVVAGCTADGRLTLANVTAYMLDELGIDASTAETGVRVSLGRKNTDPPEFGIVRVRDDIIKAGTTFHRIGQEGLVIGLLPQEEPAATDVGPDVSRRHARLWVENDRLYVVDLGSMNGTTVISSGTGAVSVVALPRSLRNKVVAQATKLHYGDFLCLGTTTRYIVLPGVVADNLLRR